MSTLRERVIAGLEERRDRLLNNKLNCIPSPFKRFSNDLVGVEQACYYNVVASTKIGKSQFASYFFIYEPLLFCYYTKADVRIKILYFPLEETPERVVQRFMCWLLNKHTKGEIHICPRDLRSTTNPVSEDILNVLNCDEIQDIVKYFEENVIFSTETNPTGIMKFCKKYAEEHGIVYYKEAKYKDDFGTLQTGKAFDYYIADDPDEYVIPFIDTLNLVDIERGMKLKEAMDKMSEYCAKYLRNRYHQSPVLIQQLAMESEGNESYKLNRMEPNLSMFGDSKTVSRDVNISIGLFSPFRFELKEYEGYDITKFRDNIRFLKILINRDGEAGGKCPLYFDGAICDFKELPLPNSPDLYKVYKYLQDRKSKLFFIHTVNNLKKELYRKNIFSIFATLFSK